MWPFERRSARGKEIRRSITERTEAWYRPLLMDFSFFSVFTSVATALAAAFILNMGQDRFAYRPGQVTSRGIPARVDVQIADELKTTEMRLRARDGTPNYYRLDEALLGDIEGRLTNVLAVARATASDPERVRAEAAKARVLLDDEGLAELIRLASVEDGSEYTQKITALIARLAPEPLVDPASLRTRTTTASTAVLYDPTTSQERRRDRRQIIFVNDAEAVERTVAQACDVIGPALRSSLTKSILAMLRSEDAEAGYLPLYRFDGQRTLEEARKNEDEVQMQYLRYAAGNLLADIGPISEDELALLNAEQKQFTASLRSEEDPQKRREFRTRARLMGLGRVLLAFLVVFGVAAYMVRYQPAAYAQTFRRSVSSVALLVLFALTRLLHTSTEAPPNLVVGLHALGAALLGIVYTQGAVFAICGASALLMTVAVQQNVGFFVVLLVVSATFVFGLREVRNRGRIVMVGGLAAAAGYLVYICVGLIDGQRILFLLREGAWAAGATLMASFIIEGVLPGVERLFRLSTGMTLLEWCDANRPVLRRMATEAPGTYNHSLTVSALAERAAEAVKANSLLCRTGALYHDIGKINKPDYFVENQPPGVSRHERLSPAMSLLIIVGHVKDGVEMAREYKLPSSLIPFIREHHGTTLVEYFYHAAVRQRRPDDPEVDEAAYRYPGPKPQSRETAIVMMCDAVEGAVRAMSEPTPNRIEAVVSEIIHQRLADGQFDQCDLTFQELALIEKSLVKSLCGIYHARIAYPEGRGEKRTNPSRSAS